jgi:hypothetical protein
LNESCGTLGAGTQEASCVEWDARTAPFRPASTVAKNGTSIKKKICFSFLLVFGFSLFFVQVRSANGGLSLGIRSGCWRCPKGAVGRAGTHTGLYTSACLRSAIRRRDPFGHHNGAWCWGPESPSIAILVGLMGSRFGLGIHVAGEWRPDAEGDNSAPKKIRSHPSPLWGWFKVQVFPQGPRCVPPQQCERGAPGWGGGMLGLACRMNPGIGRACGGACSGGPSKDAWNDGGAAWWWGPPARPSIHRSSFK